MLLLFQHPFPESNTWGKYLRYTTFYQLGLSEFRVFQLIADSNLVAGTHKFRKILRQGMVRNPGHRGITLLAVGLTREHNPQHLAGDECVVAVGFIEIPHAEEQHRIRILRLHAEILLQQRGIFLGFCHIKANIINLEQIGDGDGDDHYRRNITYEPINESEVYVVQDLGARHIPAHYECESESPYHHQHVGGNEVADAE